MRNLAEAFDKGARFLKTTNPNANINAFLAHWRQEFGISQQEARDLYDEVTEAMSDLGVPVNSFNDFKELAVAIIDIPEEIVSIP